MLAPGPTPRQRPRTWRVFQILLVSGGALTLAALAFWPAGSTFRRTPPGAGAVSNKSLTGGYVGSRTCGECHPGESASFSRSGHALTLRPAAGVPLARGLDGRTFDDPEFPDVRWTYSLSGGRLAASRSTADGKAGRFVLDYAFGSDHHATTFVSLADSQRMPATEHRLTHYSPGDLLKVTPGQSAAKPYPGTKPHGREMPDWETLACFRCHTTRTSASGPNVLKLDEMIANVSCERCHGPAESHLEALREGKSPPPMPFGPDRWTAETQMALCGKCHRHPSEALPGRLRPEIPALARFQPIGIMQSKCYQSSDGAFSCVNCHDPHARSSSDRRGYEVACLQCHGVDPQTRCRVEPRGACIECHMPPVDTGQGVLFTDHWIRVRGPSDPPIARPARR